MELVAIDKEPDWAAIAPQVVRLRTTWPLPAVPFPRLRRLELWGRGIDDVARVPAGLHALSLEQTSVLDLDALPPVKRLVLTESRYAITHGFGPRRRVAAAFVQTIDDLACLGLARTETDDDVMAHVAQRSPRLDWLDLAGNRRLRSVDLLPFERLRTANLSDVHAGRALLPSSVRALNLFRAHVAEPLDLSGLTRLEVLDLSYARSAVFADAVLATLPDSVPLRKVQLDRAGVSAKGLAALVSRAPGIEELNLDCADIDDADVALLARFPALRALSLKQTAVSDAAALPQGLEKLDVRYTRVTSPPPVDDRVVAWDAFDFEVPA